MANQSEQVDPKKRASEFLGQFDLEKFGFYDATPYSDGSIGFSTKKDFKKKDDKTTLVSVYVFEGSTESLKPVIMYATYGEVVDEGVRIRSEYSFFDPIDIESRDEYFFNILNKEFFNKKHKKISANEMIQEFYDQHIKSTKIIRGFWTRVKMFFWRIFLNFIFKYFSKLFYILLYIVSGDKYFYEYFFDEVIDKEKKYSQNDLGKEKILGSEKVDFFGYSVKKWPIVVYVIFHMATYFLLSYFGYRPIVIKTIFKNNFLTIVYVIFSIWLIESAIPIILKFFVRFFSKISFMSQTKKISI